MAGDKPSIAVIGGTGPLGSGLARRLYAAGYAVVIGSRTAAKAEAAVAALASANGPGRLTGADNVAAAAQGEVVFLTVPWASQADILAAIKPHLAGKLLVDAGGGFKLEMPTRVISVTYGRSLRDGTGAFAAYVQKRW